MRVKYLIKVQAEKRKYYLKFLKVNLEFTLHRGFTKFVVFVWVWVFLYLVVFIVRNVTDKWLFTCKPKHNLESLTRFGLQHKRRKVRAEKF